MTKTNDSLILEFMSDQNISYLSRMTMQGALAKEGSDFAKVVSELRTLASLLDTRAHEIAHRALKAA